MAQPKILFVAGHANIRNLAPEGMCPGRDIDELRRGTGSTGEVEWTGSVAGLLRDALSATGQIEARATDATYSKALYADWRPDLVVACHFHRGPSGHAAIAWPDAGHGYHTADASKRSQAFAERWMGGYTQATEIPVTQALVNDRMTDLYTWCFIDEASQAAIIEFGNANEAGDRQALYEPGIARIVKYVRDVALEHFGISYNTNLEQPRRRAADRERPPHYLGQSADRVLKVGESAQLAALFEGGAPVTVQVVAAEPGRYPVTIRPRDEQGREILDQAQDAIVVVDVTPA